MRTRHKGEELAWQRGSHCGTDRQNEVWGGGGVGAVEGDAKESKDGGELTEAAQAPQGGRETVKGGAAR